MKSEAAAASAARQTVRDVFERVMNAGEVELVWTMAHPDFVNHEADPERRHGPGAWAETRQHLRAASVTSPTKSPTFWWTATSPPRRL